MHHWTVFVVAVAATVAACSVVTGQEEEEQDAINPASTIDCHRREYTFKVHKTDSLGRKCWDHVVAMSCWGRCDSHEIADWKFPYKKSFHPVCMHDLRQLKATRLRNCEPGVEPGTSFYEFHEAITCSCHVCNSTMANCEGMHRSSHPDDLNK